MWTSRQSQLLYVKTANLYPVHPKLCKSMQIIRLYTIADGNIPKSLFGNNFGCVPKVSLKRIKVKSFASFKKNKCDTKSVPTANDGQLHLQSHGVTKTSTTQSTPMPCAEEHIDMENQCTHGNLSMIFLQ